MEDHMTELATEEQLERLNELGRLASTEGEGAPISFDAAAVALTESEGDA